MPKLGVLTSGGDCAGLNAVIRAVTKVARNEFQADVIGIRDGFHGLLSPPQIVPLGPQAVQGLLPRGGTILGSSNRGNPFRWIESGQAPVDRSVELIATAKDLGLDMVVVIGGDGSLAIARDFAARGLPVVGVPKTIDNDIALTDLTFGFDTAVSVATDAIDRLHTTAESHHRIMLIEVMGRDVGWIALASGLAGGADVILIPEIPFTIAGIVRKIEDRVARGSRFSIIVVAEGVSLADAGQVYADAQHKRLGGAGQRVAEALCEATGRDTRCTVLGHVQRGGSPTPFDRVLATRFGAAAARAAIAGRSGCMVALSGSSIVEVDLAAAVAELKRVPVGGELVHTARGLGISFGDDA